jgi:MFS family permease
VAQAVVSAPEHERQIGFFGLMRNRNYALLWWGQLVSEVGNRFHWIAVSLWVYKLAGTASAVSLAISSMFAGTLIVGLWAGVLVDRLNRKAILVVSDFVRAILVALIPSLIQINMGFVYLDLFLISVATSFFRPARIAIIPAIVGRRDLMPANSFFTAIEYGAEIFGSALAGYLAFAFGYPFGYAVLLYLDASTYVVSSCCTLGMTTSPKLTGTDKGPEPPRARTVTAGLVEGFRYIRRDMLQWGLFMLLFPTALVTSGLNSLQTPLAKGVVGITDKQFGTFNSAWGVGFLVASLVVGWFGMRVRKGLIIFGGFFLNFLSTGLMGLIGSFGSLLLTAFGVGFANTTYLVGLSTVLMEHTPGQLIGRVIAIRQVAIGFLRVVVPLVFGLIADNFGVRGAVLGLAATGAIGTALVMRNPATRKFDTGPAEIDERMFAFFRRAVGAPSPEFEAVHQRWLNLAALGVAFAGWFGIYNYSPVRALEVLIAVLVLTFGGAGIRKGRWFQSRPFTFGNVRGRENGGPEESPSQPDRDRTRSDSNAASTEYR